MFAGVCLLVGWEGCGGAWWEHGPAVVSSWDGVIGVGEMGETEELGSRWVADGAVGRRGLVGGDSAGGDETFFIQRFC